MGEGIDLLTWRAQAIGAGEAATLFGLSRERFLRNIACLPSFPARVNRKPATWVRGEVLDWRDRNRADVRPKAA